MTTSIVDLARGLSSALIGKLGIPDCIGALILDQLFPSSDDSGPPSYFTEVYQQIKNIVHTELTQAEMNRVNAVINGTNDWVRTEYKIMKDDPKKSAELFQELNRRHEQFYTDVIAPLQLKDYAMVGFPVFLIGAGAHLALLQELAIRDDDVPGDPWSSDYTKLLLEHATQYGQHAATTWPLLIAARRGQVTLIEEKVQWERYWWAYHWEDQDGTVSEKIIGSDPGWGKPIDREQARALAQADMEKHQDAVAAQLAADMGQPDQVIANWQGLQKRPLPLASVAKILRAELRSEMEYRRPQGCGFVATISWATADAAEVFLDDTPAAVEGTQQYRWFEPEHGGGAGPRIPGSVTAVDKHGCPISQTLG